MASRRIDALHPSLQPAATSLLLACEANGIDVLVTCTYRSQAEQDELYAQGRTKPGRIVTWTLHSKHCNALPDGTPAALALDIVPLRHGVTVWGTQGNGLDNDPTDDDTDDLELWERVGILGEQAGFEWGGRWRSPDRPHFQGRHEV